MRPSLLMIVVLTGNVYSRGLWSVFSALFGDKADSEEQNQIPDDDENYKKAKFVDNRHDGMENNEIILKDPYTQRNEWNQTDNRVGWIHPFKADPSTEEGYKKYLKLALEYIRNLSNQDHGLGQGAGPAYTQLHQRFGEYDNYGNLLWDDGYPDDGDGGDPDFDGDFGDPDYDGDFGAYDFGHDELK